MDESLNYGLNEAPSPGEYLYDPLLLSAEGPYGSALLQLDKLAARTQGICEADIRRLKLRVIHECEEAKRWAEIADVDYPSAQVKRGDSVASAFETARKAVRLLRLVDQEEPFYFRDTFKGALEKQVGPPQDLRVWQPNQNLDDGGLLLEADAKTKSHIEYQLVWRIALFGLGDLLEELDHALSEEKRKGSPWRKIGPLRVSPALSRKQVAKLDVGILGLSARLAYVFREWTAGRKTRPYWPGLEMPADGSPNWRLVAEFVNLALEPAREQDAESLRKRWDEFSGLRSVRLDPWPRLAVREPQTRKKKIVTDGQAELN